MELHLKDYTLKELHIGMQEKFSTVVTEEMMNKFTEISGDYNPLHRDPAFAKSVGFPDKVVFGMLTASLISTLGGCYLPGKHCLIQGIEAKFARAVMVGDILTVVGEVAKIYEELNCVEIKVTITNQAGEKVLRGKLKAGVLHE